MGTPARVPHPGQHPGVADCVRQGHLHGLHLDDGERGPVLGQGKV